MATKDKMLRKKLIKEGVISLVVIACLTGAGLLLSNYDDDAVAEKQNKQNETAAMRTEHDSIQAELGSGFEVGAFYNNYTENHNPDFMLRRETATQWMSALVDKNHVTNLSVTISPITNVTADFAPLKIGTMIKSDVHLTFNALTDNSVFGFMESLERKLPGIVLIKELKIVRNSDLSRGVLMDLSQHKITPMVSAEISFIWVGIHFNDEDRDNATSPANGNAHD